MKKIIILMLFFIPASIIFGQVSPQNHFYAHGWFNDASLTVPLGTYVNSIFDDFDNNGHHTQWNTMAIHGIQSQVDGIVIPSLDLNNKKHWVGIGFSMGGLVCRAATHSQGQLSQPPPTLRNFESFVTFGTPNQGNIMTWRFPFFARDAAHGLIAIAHGYASILANLGYLLWAVVESAIILAGVFELSSFPTMDMIPDSNFLTSINGSTKQNYELSLPRQRAAIWGKYGNWKLAGLDGGRSASNDYQAKIDKCNSTRAYWVNRDRKLKKTRNIIKIIVNWPKRIYARMRASDWRISKEGYQLLELSWVMHTSELQDSDCFIAASSQRNDGVFSGLNTYIDAIHGNDNIEEVSHTQMIDEDDINKCLARFAVRRALYNMEYQ